jgi:Lipocalin-like domain
MRRIVTLSLFVLSVVSSGSGQSNDDPARRLLGAWRLVSVEGTSPVFNFVYDRPQGLIIYDSSGRVAVQQANVADRKPFAQGPAAGTVDEKAAAFDSYGAYYGRYSVDARAGTVTHHIENGLNPALRGRDNVRWFEFQSNDRLVMVPTEDGKGGVIAKKDATYKLTWERIR